VEGDAPRPTLDYLPHGLMFVILAVAPVHDTPTLVPIDHSALRVLAP
jgi:hypothetical protein